MHDIICRPFPCGLMSVEKMNLLATELLDQLGQILNWMSMDHSNWVAFHLIQKDYRIPWNGHKYPRKSFSKDALPI